MRAPSRSHRSDYCAGTRLQKELGQGLPLSAGFGEAIPSKTDEGDDRGRNPVNCEITYDLGGILIAPAELQREATPRRVPTSVTPQDDQWCDRPQACYERGGVEYCLLSSPERASDSCHEVLEPHIARWKRIEHDRGTS